VGVSGFFATIVTGLIIGDLGRLAVRGKQNILIRADAAATATDTQVALDATRDLTDRTWQLQTLVARFRT
jgi:hypothetical protein